MILPFDLIIFVRNPRVSGTSPKMIMIIFEDDQNSQDDHPR